MKDASPARQFWRLHVPMVLLLSAAFGWFIYVHSHHNRLGLAAFYAVLFTIGGLVLAWRTVRGAAEVQREQQRLKPKQRRAVARAVMAGRVPTDPALTPLSVAHARSILNPALPVPHLTSQQRWIATGVAAIVAALGYVAERPRVGWPAVVVILFMGVNALHERQVRWAHAVIDATNGS